MPYVTQRASPLTRQLTLDDMLFGNPKRGDYYVSNETNTYTRFYDTVPEAFQEKYSVLSLIGTLDAFNTIHKALREADRSKQYRQYQIPKSSGGFRTISDPIPELKEAQRQLVSIFKTSFGALYHTAAFAYVEGRCAIDAVQRHQQNESYWFCGYDFHDFFGSTTKPFVESMLYQLFPFSLLAEYERGRRALSDALDLCFLNGGLPQGAVSSPMITNLMMIPIDMFFANRLHLVPFGRNDTAKDQAEEVRYIYTRYADDILISSRAAFDYKQLERDMREFLQSVGAPFTFNSKKTSYGNRSGSNFHLGVILNAENEIRVGWHHEDELRKNINAYLYDRKRGITWNYDRLAHLSGIISYYRKVNSQRIDEILHKYERKYQVDVLWMLRHDIKTAVR